MRDPGNFDIRINQLRKGLRFNGIVPADRFECLIGPPGRNRFQVFTQPGAQYCQIALQLRNLLIVGGQLVELFGRGEPIAMGSQRRGLSEGCFVGCVCRRFYQLLFISKNQGDLDRADERCQKRHRPRIVGTADRGLQEEMSLGGENVSFAQQGPAKHADRFVDTRWHLLFNGGERGLQYQHGLQCLSARGSLDRPLCKHHGIAWMFRLKNSQRFFERFLLLHLGMQKCLDRQQTGAVRIFLERVLNMFEAGQPLVSFEHPLDTLQFTQQVLAAELNFLASASWTRHVSVEGHGR